MKSTALLLVTALRFSHAFADNIYRRDIKGEAVVELDKKQVIDDNTQQIPFKGGDDDPFDHSMTCPQGSGKKFTLSADKKFVACCLPDQNLAGSGDTEFQCCAKDHYLAHSDSTGKNACCPLRQEYDGKICKKKEPPVEMCKNGKKMVEGMCICPDGTKEVGGVCKKSNSAKDCKSEVETGKCYEIFIDGKPFGFGEHGYSAAAPPSEVVPGKFQFCKNPECKSSGSINPGEAFRIKNLRGLRKTGGHPNQWIDAAANGNHAGKTPDYDKAGNFTLTKWPCGKYCLSGYEHGVGPTCAAEDNAITFYTNDKDACVPITINEIPCDIRDSANNCLWSARNQCCNDVCEPSKRGISDDDDDVKPEHDDNNKPDDRSDKNVQDDTCFRIKDKNTGEYLTTGGDEYAFGPNENYYSVFRAHSAGGVDNGFTLHEVKRNGVKIDFAVKLTETTGRFAPAYGDKDAVWTFAPPKFGETCWGAPGKKMNKRHDWGGWGDNYRQAETGDECVDVVVEKADC